MLEEATILSKNLSLIAEAGLAAMSLLHDHKKPLSEWLLQQTVIMDNAKQQGGRCELQVVIPIEKLLRAAGAN